jgi:hypothetical protein
LFASPVVLALLSLAGCSSDPARGYSFANQYQENIRTVAVPIFDIGKDVYRRGLEFRLTEALVKRIELDTPYKVVEKKRADTELRGRIEQVEQRVLSFNPDTGLPREAEITFTVSFTWTDLRSGKVLASQSRFRQAGTYLPQRPIGEDFFQGSEDVINRLARRVVEHMEKPW